MCFPYLKSRLKHGFELDSVFCVVSHMIEASERGGVRVMT